MPKVTGSTEPVAQDHRLPGPPPSVALRGASTGTHDYDVLAGRLDGGEPK